MKYPRFGMMLFVAGVVVVFGAPASGEKNLKADSPPLTGIRRLEEAFAGASNDSILREGELAQKKIEISKRLREFLEKMPNGDSQKPLKDLLTPSQLDEFNLLSAQLKYLNASSYALESAEFLSGRQD